MFQDDDKMANVTAMIEQQRVYGHAITDLWQKRCKDSPHAMYLQGQSRKNDLFWLAFMANHKGVLAHETLAANTDYMKENYYEGILNTYMETFSLLQEKIEAILEPPRPLSPDTPKKKRDDEDADDGIDYGFDGDDEEDIDLDLEQGDFEMFVPGDAEDDA